MSETISSLINWYLAGVYHPAFHWVFLPSAFAYFLFSYLYYGRGVRFVSIRDFFKFCFPKAIYTHPSAKADYKYVLIYPFIGALISATWLGLFLQDWAKDGIQVVLGAVIGGSLPEITPSLTVSVVLTVITILVNDLGYYCQHLAFHKIPFFWEFHKTHHSAEVLTPITGNRLHPVEVASIPLIALFLKGLLLGGFAFFLSPEIQPIGKAIATMGFLYYFMGYLVNHSHVWVSYGPILNRIFISPAQHQIHHSKALKHRDKNLGGQLAIWDWLFGTLYLPDKKEDIQFGVGDGEDWKYQSPWQLFILPFKKNLSDPIRRYFMIALLIVLGYFLVAKVFVKLGKYL